MPICAFLSGRAAAKVESKPIASNNIFELVMILTISLSLIIIRERGTAM
jgi:hypothetical protein